MYATDPRGVADAALERVTRAALAVAALLPLLLVLAVVWAGYAAAEDSASDATACPGHSLLATLTPDQTAALEAAAVDTPNGEGRLFSVTKGNLAPSYLFGTMHLTDPRVLSLPEAADKAFDHAETLVIETTDVLDERKAATAMLARPDLTTLPPGQSLDDLLTPQQRSELEEGLEEHGLVYGAIKTLQPWFSGVTLLLPACEVARKAAGQAVLDVSLARQAEAEGKPVLGLEKAEEQLEAMASLPMDLQVDSLLASVALADQMPDVMATMTELYLDGRIGEIAPLTELVAPMAGPGSGSEPGAAYAEFEERVVTARNHTMAERLEPILEDGGAFVAIGALHLPGKEGLVELLRRDGWTVKRAD
ncbi:TraB/GumN family protein [Consotaella aegiceratis]|uniref:TraB/GumN family protein n=1 Tax=Consotaella aegiceratis TaxID=3097961 RepID=UPI002F3F6282